MKAQLLFLTLIMVGFDALASQLVCRSRLQTFVLKQGSTSLYQVFECDKNVVGCTPAQVFEALGFEDEGLFSLHGMRANGQRSVIKMEKTPQGWLASLSLAGRSSVLDVMLCEAYRK